MKTKDRVMGVQSYKTVTKARLVKEPTELPRIKIDASRQAYEFAVELYDGDIEVIESFYCIFLNRGNNITSFSEISHGGTVGTVVDLKVIFNLSLQLLAQALIFVHNHPSGNTQPSEADKSLTKELQRVGDFHKIQILDHIIVTPHAYFSFADMGLL